MIQNLRLKDRIPRRGHFFKGYEGGGGMCGLLFFNGFKRIFFNAIKKANLDFWAENEFL
jgi:hypothetical protein